MCPSIGFTFCDSGGPVTFAYVMPSVELVCRKATIVTCCYCFQSSSLSLCLADCGFSDTLTKASALL